MFTPLPFIHRVRSEVLSGVFPRHADTEAFRRRWRSAAGDGHKISECECKSDFGETRVILTDSLSRL